VYMCMSESFVFVYVCVYVCVYLCVCEREKVYVCERWRSVCVCVLFRRRPELRPREKLQYIGHCKAQCNARYVNKPLVVRGVVIVVVVIFQSSSL
jgi:hypothetical protein